MRNEKGFTLIEVIIAMALLGIIAIAFLGGLATASKALIIADERATAESLARSQMEAIKNQEYKPADVYDAGIPESGQVTYDITVTDPSGVYTICSINREGIIIDNTIYGVPWDSQDNQRIDTDGGLQRIKLVIKHAGNPVLTLEDYKVNR